MRCQGGLNCSKESTNTRGYGSFPSVWKQYFLILVPMCLYTPPPPAPWFILLAIVPSRFGGETMCLTAHGLLHANGSCVTFQNTFGALDLLLWLSSGCSGVLSITGHPGKAPTVVLWRNPYRPEIPEEMSISYVCRKLEDLKKKCYCGLLNQGSGISFVSLVTSDMCSSCVSVDC